jgi:hypothetical protein
MGVVSMPTIATSLAATVTTGTRITATGHKGKASEEWKALALRFGLTVGAADGVFYPEAAGMGLQDGGMGGGMELLEGGGMAKERVDSTTFTTQRE